MDKQTVKDLINVVSTSSDKAVICKALIKLRTDLVKDKEGILIFYSCDGIAPLIRLISKPYEKILESALSILGNCCTNKDCCKQALSNGIVPPLLTILKSIPNPSVQCKACRLIGNLARESNEKICNLAKGLGVAIASVMEDNQDKGTLMMAIRAVRLLWNEMPFSEEFVRSDGVKKIIGTLVKYAKLDQKSSAQSIVEKYPEEKARVEFMEEHTRFMESVNSRVFDQEIIKKARPIEDLFKMPHGTRETELFLEIFRCLQVVTVGPSLRVIYDFYVDQHGCNSIVFFAKSNSPFREQALRILSNLSRCQNSIEVLCSANAVTVACDLITKQNLDPDPALNQTEQRYCVNIICFLSRDACNRAKIRMSGAFRQLLEIAKNTECDTILSTILIGLQSFKYDSVSIGVMIKMGLVKVLVERLDINTKDLSENHTKRIRTRSFDDKSVVNEDIVEENLKSKKMKVEYSPSVYVPTSPSNNTSNYSYPNSPCSSSGLSPKNTPPRVNEPNADECSDYSPVCSDIEDINEDDNGDRIRPKDNEKIDSMEKDGSAEMELENIVQSEEEEETEEENPDNSSDAIEKKKNIQLIISILSEVSYRAKFASDLCTPSTLNSLIRTCRVAFKRNNPDSKWDEQGAPLILSHIISETVNFTRIIKQNFIFEIYKFTENEKEHKNCSTCMDLQLVGNGLLNTVKKVAETGYGRGELAHLLLKGEKDIQKQVAVVTTYIIGDPKILHMLLVGCGGLYIVMEIVLSKTEELSNEAACGFTSLSKMLGIVLPDCDKSKIHKDSKYNCNNDLSQGDTPIVTFIAGSGDGGNDADGGIDADSAGGDGDNSNNTNNRIEFSEKILMEFSEVFHSMLKSDFKESKSREIHLKNQTKDGIKYLLDSINQMSKQESLHIPQSNLISAVLEAHDMCQIYMLTELEQEIFNVILFMLNEQTVLTIFQFSIVNHKHALSEVSIKYYLSANIRGESKVKMYREADNSDHYKEWNQMMLDAVVYTCESLMTSN